MIYRDIAVIRLSLRHMVHSAYMFTAVYKKERRGYVAWLEEMPGVLTQGATRVEARHNLADALHEYLAARRALTKKSSRRGSVLVRERLKVS